MSAVSAESGILDAPLRIPRWPSEAPLRVLVALVAAGLWVVLALSIFGIVYAAILGVVLLVAQLAFVAHLRGSAVRLGPEQMPDLYARVETLSRRIGLARVPDAYVMQAGGALNAFATQFLRTNFIVLFTELLDACGDNAEARDFIVAHELGHLHAGHLRWRWLLLPGLAFPFLGTAYSRACEYTCDRYGRAASENGERALDGLCILAAGGREGPRVNRRALVAQRADLDNVAMKIGQWMSTHPPIAHRLAALEPHLGDGTRAGRGAAMGAFLVVTACLLLPVLAGVYFFSQWWPGFQAAIAQQQLQQTQMASAADPLQAEVDAGILGLANAAEAARAEGSGLPAQIDALYDAWSSHNPGEAPPLDPHSGSRFGYRVEGEHYVIWTTGPDPKDPSDDRYFSSAEHGKPPGVP